MPGLAKFREVVERVRCSLRWRWESEAPVPGLPEGLDRKVLEEVCREHHHARLLSVAHKRLTAWRESGVYRLFLRTGEGPGTLIFNNAIRSVEHLPAYAGMPRIPGRAAYLVYGKADGPLAGYIPKVYSCRELVPGEHYQYLLEDLEGEYRQSSEAQAILCAAAELPRIHRALGDWARSLAGDCLGRYGLEFSQGLQEYVRKNLELYAQMTTERAFAEAWKLWAQISEWQQGDGFQMPQDACLIHGDFSPPNIFIHWGSPPRLKVVDWEWAGWGVPHTDLACLLKTSAPEVEEQALATYTRQNLALSLDEHRQVYERCQLERGLFEAAFGAAHRMSLPADTRINVENLHRGIVRALERAVRAYQWLSGSRAPASFSQPGPQRV